MKLAISIPDKLFKEAETLAKTTGSTRSGLIAKALAEYMARHDADAVTEAMNRVADAVGEDEFAPLRRRGAKRLAEQDPW